MANVKVPALLHKMSKTVQKAWYKKNNMEMPNEPAERSAAVAKRVKVAPRKASDVKPDSVRAINTARMAAYMAKGGRAPIGAAGSGGNSVMAGSNMSTVRGMITGIKAGFNPKVSLDPYESERAKKTGPRSLKLKKEEVEQVDEGAKEDAEKLLGGPVKTKPKMPPGKQPAGYRYVRALARRAMKAGLKKEEVEQVDEIDYGGTLSRYINKTRNNPDRKAGNALALKKKWGDKNYGLEEPKVKGMDRNEEVEQVDEIDYKKYLKVSQEKRPFTIRTVDAALKTDKAGDPNPLRKLGNTNKARKFAQKQLTKKFNASQPARPFPVYEPGRTYVGDSVEHDGPVIDEARRMSAAEKLGRAFDSEQQRSALSRQRGLDLLKQKDTEKTQNKLASGDMTKLKKEEIEESTMKYIEEKLTAADPASKYIKDFVASENPKFAGKSKKERISMALGAYYAKKRGTNEEVELDESHGAEKLGDMLESDADHETKMKRIKIAPTAHLKYLHKYNMGYSGGGDHPMTKHIKDELKNRKMKNEEVEQVDEGASHLLYSGEVNGKDYEYTVRSDHDLSDDNVVHKALKQGDNDHLEPHEIKAIVDSGGEEESHVDVTHNGKKYKHHVINHQEPQRLYGEEVEQVDEITGYEGVKDRKDIIKRSAAMYRMGKQTFLDRVKTRAAEMKKEKAAKNLAKEEVVLEEPKDAADVGEYDYEGDMAKSQLRSIMANSKRMHDMLEDTTNLPEWVQSKITLAEDYVVTAANYMEGEMNEEVEQMDEVKGDPGKALAKSIASRVNKHTGNDSKSQDAVKVTSHEDEHFVHQRYDDDGSQFHTSIRHNDGKFTVSHETPHSNGSKTFSSAEDAANHAHKLWTEEVEQTDEAIRGYITHKPAGLKGLRTADRSVEIRRPADQAERDTLAKNLAANRKYNLGKIGRKSGYVRKNAAGTAYGQKTSIAVGSTAGSKELGPKKFRYAEEVEQTDEAIRGYIQKGGDNAYLGVQVRRPANQAERDKLAQDIAANRKYNAGKNIGRKSGNVRANAAGMTQSQKNAVTAFSTASNKELGPKRYSYESVEGKVAVTPKEKSLAAHHGDKTKITYGDVIKARLKSAAAKKMGK